MGEEIKGPGHPKGTPQRRKDYDFNFNTVDTDTLQTFRQWKNDFQE